MYVCLCPEGVLVDELVGTLSIQFRLGVVGVSSFRDVI